jgi:hypothetical protein
MLDITDEIVDEDHAPDDESTASWSCTMKQATLPLFVESKRLYDINDERARKIHKAICEMLCLNSMPFNFVESVGFKELMSSVCPRYKVPSRKYFSDNLIPKVYLKVQETVKRILNDRPNEGITITSDIWTFGGGHDYISVTAHFIDVDFERNHVLLEVMGFDGERQNGK